MSPIKLILAATVALALVSPASALTTQQEKMKTCNADATTKKLGGDDRKTFVATCLKAEAAPPVAKPLTAQQEKMKTCNTEAGTKSLKGKDRQTFMSTCLKG